eukprot:scaffold18354_cov134-Isochrysis_galbana.AAC.3
MADSSSVSVVTVPTCAAKPQCTSDIYSLRLTRAVQCSKLQAPTWSGAEHPAACCCLLVRFHSRERARIELAPCEAAPYCWPDAVSGPRDGLVGEKRRRLVPELAQPPHGHVREVMVLRVIVGEGGQPVVPRADVDGAGGLAAAAGRLERRVVGDEHGTGRVHWELPANLGQEEPRDRLWPSQE